MIHRYLRIATLGLLAAAGFTAQAAPCPTTSLTPSTTLPAATVGTAYLQAFGASNSNAQPFDFRITGGLPAGFGLGMTSTGAASANLTGAPTQTGSYLVTITATDTLGCSGGRTYALSVAQGSQTISFTSTPPASAAVGGTAYSVSATATSGLPVTLAIDASASAVCSIAGTSVSFQNPGTCVINANQAGDANYAAAPQVQQSFAVGRADQTLSFTSTAPAAAVVGGTAYSVSATATSGLAAAFSIDASASSVCAIAGNSVTFLSAGTCVVNANQAGNANFNPAPQIQQSFAVGPGSQTISFTSTAPAAAVVAGAAYTVTGTATSGLPVAFTIDASASGVCSIAGSSVSFIGAGTCVINANQAGNANWNAAPQVQQSFAVARGSQTISFTSTAPAAATVGGAAYTVTATATSGLTVAFTIDASATSVCSATGSTVIFLASGTCVINANQAGNANYNAAPQVQQSFAVAAGSQSIFYTSTAPAAAVVGGPTYTVTATASSGLPVAFTIDASASAVCALAGNTVSFTGAGTCVINANQAGNANYSPAPQVQQSFVVARGSQTISFTSTAPAAATVSGATYTVTGTATSGLPVAFTIDAAASGVCSIAGSTVSFIGAGTCVINANQAGNANWNAAPQVQQSFAVARGSQTISFTSTAPAAATVSGATYTVTGTATSGLPVAFTIDASASGVCSIAGSTVSFIGAGTCVINANQAGNANWNAAPQVQQSFAVARGSQTISFTSTAPAAATVAGGTYTVTGTATSGLPVAFTIDAAASGVCSIAGSTIGFIGAGTCVINANQAGNANWNAAPQVQQSFAVARSSQTISFTSTAPAAATVAGPTYTVTANASSGLPVAFTIDASASGVCSIAGSTVSFIGAGTCVINANQAGSSNWNAAPQVQQSFTVSRTNQTISFTSTAPAAATFGGPTYTVTATATSGLPVAFTIDAAASGVCSIAGSTVSFIGVGTCVINANQTGDATFNPAPQVQQSFVVARADQTITFTSTAPTNANVTGGATYTVTATATSGLTVSFAIDPSAAAVCSISGSTVSFLAAGTCVINADQAGDANWNAAPQVQQSFVISACLDLALGQVVRAPVTGSASVCIQSSSGAVTEYTYLPISLATSGNTSVTVTGTDIQPVTGPPTPRPEASLLAPLAAAPDAPVDLHAFETPAAFPSGHVHSEADLVTPRGTGPLTVGQLIDLNASVGACGIATDIRKARVEAITTPQTAGQPVLYAVQEVVEQPAGSGTWVPAVAGGYQTVDFQNMMNAFVQAPPGATPGASFSTTTLLRTGAMDILRTNLGELSDIDSNGGVIVFFTKKLNELSPPASSTVVPGMFQPRDLFAAASCGGSNQGEILYLFVPDPTGSVNSNVRTISFTYGNAGPTMIHHAEHLFNASRRLYFNGAAPLEQFWLDEALAWSMQELVFYSTSVGLVPRGNIQLSTLTTGPNASVRVAAFNTFENTMYGQMRSFFYQLGSSNGSVRLGPLRQQPHSTGTLPESHDLLAGNFAHTHTFLRYALDRLNTGDTAVFNALVNTSQVGTANLTAALGVNANDWVPDFLVAAYADDAGIAGVAAQYTLPSWNYRSVYGGLGGFPLAVDNPANGTPLTANIGPGGGTRYIRVGVAAGQLATIAITDNSGTNPALSTAIIRTK